MTTDQDAHARGGDVDEGERSQISEHLDMTPRERLDRLLDLLAFEERARRARVVRKLRS